jgi:hypothetical protein
MQLVPSDKSKTKIKRKRKKYDKNFRVFKYIQYLAEALFVVSLVWLVADVHEDLITLLQVFSMCICFILAIAMAALVSSMTGTRVTDMFSEHLEIRDGYLIHSYNRSAGGGFLNGIEGDNREFDFIPLNRGTNITVDERTGRLELAGIGHRILIKCGERVIYDFTSDKVSIKVMYDYFEPSLIAELDKMGVVTEKKSISYQLNETPEEYRGWKGNKKLREDVKTGKATVL